jgi:hypothetical protein
VDGGDPRTRPLAWCGQRGAQGRGGTRPEDHFVAALEVDASRGTLKELNRQLTVGPASADEGGAVIPPCHFLSPI